MPVESPHPQYTEFREEWDLMRASLGGPRVVRDGGVLWLPRPTAFPDGTLGDRMYQSYQARARFPDVVIGTVAGMTGLIHRTEWQIEGLEEGKPLASLWERATKDGLPLEAFARRMTSEILALGRYSVLVDLPAEGADAPWLAGYSAEMLLNWDEESRELFVLDESAWVRDPENYEWTWEPRYRELRMRDGVYEQELHIPGRPAASEEEDEKRVFEPTMRGQRRMERIPLVVAGPRDLRLSPELPPLVGVARAALAAYQLDADYRHQLFWSGQETLFVSGMNQDQIPTVVGAGVVVAIQDKDGRAEYVGPKGVGIDAHRTAIQGALQDAVRSGAQLFDVTDVPDESGTSRKLRYAAQTATLTTIAQASASALEAALRHAAEFVGQDPEEIVVTPNLDFVDSQMTPSEAEALVRVWQSGAISYETTYENLQRGGIASEERTAEEEQELIDQETPDEALPGGDLLGGTDEDVDDLFDSRFVETGEGLEIEAT